MFFSIQKMKKYLFLLFSFITSLLVISCQDEDFGYTEEEIFRNAYERNFEAKYGKIDSNQSWDFSTHARIGGGSLTRAMGDFVTLNEGYFEIDKSMVTWIESKLPNNTDNSSTENFGIIMSAGEFAIIPLYENGNADLGYELHMVIHNGTSEVDDKVVWTRSKDASRSSIQIKKKGSTPCTTCHEHGYVDNGGSAPCGYCDGKGYFPGGNLTCPNGCTNGILTEDCPNSNCTLYPNTDNKGRDASIKCSNCNGRGYKYGFLTINYCTECGGNGSIWTRGKRGSGHPICTSCNGAHVITRNCGLCDKGKVRECPVCNGSKTGGVLCATCGGTGSTDVVAWADLQKNETTAGATAIRTQPTYVDNSSAPAGSVVYFYLKATNKVNSYANNGDKQSSLDNKMKVIQAEKRPANISSDPETGYRIIGVEEQSQGSGNSKKDYNDLVFMVVGKPLPQVFEIKNTTDPIPLSTIQKRYMFEDFGSNADWDFNDIVVDAVETKTRKLTVSSGTLSGYTDNREAMATIKWLCGTLPLQVSFGDGAGTETYKLPEISDPTNKSQTNAELTQDPNNPVNNPSYSGKGNPGWTPKEEIKDENDDVTGYLEYSFSIKESNWTPSNNKVSLTVWKGNPSESDRLGASVWSSTFPTVGGVPYIIATDVTEAWMSEGTDITEEWWQEKTENARNSQQVVVP